MIKKDFYLRQHELTAHAKTPANFGLVANLDFVSDEHNPSCGDSVTFGGNVSKGIVTYACFTGSGCVISMAMASKLTQVVKGMSLSQINQMDDLTVEQILGLELGLNRIKCGLLSIIALKKGILLYQQANNLEL